MKKLASSILTAAALALPAGAWAEIYAYVGLPLTPTQEQTVPASTGTGSVTALYDSTTKVLLYSIVYQLHPGSTATAAHFHGPAPLGTNAGVQIGLPTTPTGNAGKVTGTVTLTAAQEVDLLAGQWYFNLHSTLASGGEMRAQLLENSATLVLPSFAGGKLMLPVVLVPGHATTASFSAELTYVGGDGFTLTAATPFR
ncbi:CHRD domain-containing protein [Aquabacterium sp.]|uniref:CHRD domain-containing protein n=1 Tax=Aquabacterium sp. TaxID=1872578 RepID=UPI002C340152|nr:CHRD domain-containing protein [Aquabacterium sp.]HSW03550.1 CHRD domain-containing protein [Aquabacterium sp.]